MALQGAAYYLGMLAYYWVLVTPSVGFLFGCYLYMSVNWFHVHYDEAFSSLQIPHHKGFSRIHVTPEGDLHIYGLAIDKVGIHQLYEDMCCSQTEMSCECWAFSQGQKGATGTGLGACGLCHCCLGIAIARARDIHMAHGVLYRTGMCS